MKKLVKVLAVLLVICSVACMFACSFNKVKPELDLSVARDNLEDRKYDVEYDRNPEDGCGAVVVQLEAYGEDDEYICIFEFESNKVAKAVYKTLSTSINAEIASYEAMIELIELVLKEYSDEMTSDEIDEGEDLIKEYKKGMKEIKDNYVVGISGKYVWYGTPNAVEDTK